MSEVDRLGNSGLYPALPIADRRSSKDERESRPRSDESPAFPAPQGGESLQDPSSQRPPRSIIDEYA
jgi:hypothetical protein